MKLSSSQFLGRPCRQTCWRKLGRLAIPLALAAFSLFLLARHIPTSASAHRSGAADAPPDLELAGHLGGLAGRVVLEGSYVYLAQGPELSIIDVSDPANPHRVGYFMLPGFTKGIAVAGGYAYTTWELCDPWNEEDCTGGLIVLDVSDPLRPAAVYSQGLPGAGSGVTLSDGYAYVLWRGFDLPDPYHQLGGMKILDVTNPECPVEMWSEQITLSPFGFAVANRYGYYVDDSYMITFDLSDPANPVQVDSTGWSWGVDITLANGYAYLAGGLSGLEIMSLADPAHPVSLSHEGIYGYEEAVAVQGNYAYLSVVESYYTDDVSETTEGTSEWCCGGLEVIDVYSPTNPVVVGYLPLPYGSEGVAVNGSLAYVSTVYNGLSVVDISQPDNPQEIGAYTAPGEAYAVAQAGRYAYTITSYYKYGASGLWVDDVSNRGNPSATGAYYDVVTSERVAVDGDYTYVLVGYNQGGYNYYNRLHIVDVADPEQITGASVLTLPNDQSVWNLDAANGYVYLAFTDRLVAVDARSPTTPTITSQVTATLSVRDVVVSGEYAYVAGGGLSVFDISAPAHPVEIAALEMPDGGLAVAVSGQYAYVVGSTYLHVVNISDPAKPIETGSVAVSRFGVVFDLSASGSFAFFAAEYDGLRVIDATDPTQPFETAVFPALTTIKGVDTSGGYVYLADWEGGLFILRYNPLIHEVFLPVVGR